MAPFSFLFVALALVSSHGVFGAPSCSTDLSSCTSKCKAKWYHHSMMSHAPQSSPVGGAKPTYPAGDYPKESPVSSPATQPMPTSTPPAPSSSHPATPSPSSNGSSGATSSSDIAAYLKAHNDFRALHGASALTWSDELASTALAWGKGCKFEHSHGQYGENLAAGTGALSIQDAVNMWTAEEKDYNPNNPVYSHFTQVVWKATTQLGCAEVTCGAGTIFPASYGTSSYVVCEYNPPGNVIGEFAQNVQV